MIQNRRKIKLLTTQSEASQSSNTSQLIRASNKQTMKPTLNLAVRKLQAIAMKMLLGHSGTMKTNICGFGVNYTFV